MTQPTMIAFDADDTLWQNETLYHHAQDVFVDLLRHYHSEDWIRARLFDTEMRNMAHFGYGIKAFVLSMIETSVQLTEGRITGAEIGVLIDQARAMIDAEIELLPGVLEVLQQLHGRYPLALITKGDLLDQHRKVQRSGLGDLFQHIEVVADKNDATYAGLISKFGVPAAGFMMVGNSLKSDILPVLRLGGQAVYIAHALTWAHESAPTPEPGTPGYFELPTISGLPQVLAKL